MKPSLAAGLVLLLMASGCSAPAPPSLDAPPEPEPSPSTPRGKSLVLADPTVPSLGGEHAHDWWGDATERIVLQREIDMGSAELCYGVWILGSCGEYFVGFPPADPGAPPNNVWPGTGRITIEVRIDGEIHAPFSIAVLAPYRWNGTQESYVVDEVLETITIGNITERQTDPPHSRASRWTFRIDAGSYTLPPGATLMKGRMEWTVRIHKGDRPLAIDPPHPDRWGNATSRLLLEKTYEAQEARASELLLTRSAYAFAPDAESTVLPLTSFMRVTIDWGTQLPVSSRPELRYCDAEGKCWSSSAAWTSPSPTQDEASRRVYDLALRPEQWDSPYAEDSEWAFSWAYGDLDPQLRGVTLFHGELKFRGEIFKA